MSATLASFTVTFTDEDIHYSHCVEEARRSQAEGKAGHTRKDSEEDFARDKLGRGNRRRKTVGDDDAAFVFRMVSQRNNQLQRKVNGESY
jgi:hypothetical protein